MNAFRIGIEWTRLEREKDEWDHEAIDHCKIYDRKGINTCDYIKPLHTSGVLNPPSEFTKKIGQVAITA